MARNRWAIAICCFVFSGCGDPFGPELSDLDQARSNWSAAHLSQYEFDFIQYCGECPVGLGVPYHVRVFSDGSITMTDIQAGSNPPDYVERPTVPGLFGKIETTLRNNPSTFRAEYDATLGYPKTVSVDPIKNAIDDEWGVSVSNLRAF
jgi:hypothetical protein